MKKLRFFAAFIAVAFILGAYLSVASAKSPRHESGRPARLDEPIPMDRDVVTGMLDNGMRYYIRENREPADRASLWLVVNAGSILEDDDQLGLAHFVEHMGFNGTKHFPKQELVRYLESIGVNLGCGGVNASTGFDQTQYFMTVPTDSVHIVENALKILADWAHGTSMEDTEIEKERGVITEEWRLWQGPGDRLMDKHLPVLFKDSRYAARLPIGTKESIAAFKPEALRRFYRDWYRPDLMAVIAVGDFDGARIKTLIEQEFGAVPRAENPRLRTVFPVPDHSEMLFSIVSDPEETGTSVGMYFMTDPKPLKTVDDYRRKLIRRFHDVMFQQRLGELAKRSDSPVLGSRSLSGRLVRSKATHYVGAWVRENEVEQGLDAVLTEIARVEQHGFSAGEFARAKHQWKRVGEWMDQGDKTSSSYFVTKCASNFLTGDPILNPGLERDLYEELVPGITLDDVNKVLAEWFAGSSRAILVSAPEKEGLALPQEASLRAVFDRIDEKKTSEIADAFAERPLMDAKPRPGKIVKEERIPELGVTEWTLSNGVRVLLRPTDSDRDRIFFEAWNPGGSSLLSDADWRSVRPLCWILRDCGLGNFDRVALKKKLTGTIAYATPQVAELFESVGGKAYRKDLETMFELIYLRFTASIACEEGFQAYVASEREALKNKNADPRWAFQDTVDMVLNQNHPRRMPMTEQMVDSITLDRGMRAYRDRFADASGFTFVFTGDFEAKDLKPLVATYVASLPAIHRTETWRDIGVRPPAGVVKKTVRRGIEQQGEVQIYFNGPFEWSRQNEWTLQAMGQILGKKLREVVREDMSATYHIGAYAGADEFPAPMYQIAIMFGCAPERVDEILRVVYAQIDSLKTAGPEERHVAAIKETAKRHFENVSTKSWYWQQELLEAYFRGEDPRNILKDPEYAVAFDARVIQDAAKKYFDMNNYIELIRMPEKESEE
jgi:zinc protease